MTASRCCRCLVFARGLDTAQAVKQLFNMFSWLRRILTLGCVGWVGWGRVDGRCTCTHVWCYASTLSSVYMNVSSMCTHVPGLCIALASVCVTDVQVSLLMLRVLILHKCLILRNYMVFGRGERCVNVNACPRVRNYHGFWHMWGWGVMTSLNSHTCLMLCKMWGWGGGGV